MGSGTSRVAWLVSLALFACSSGAGAPASGPGDAGSAADSAASPVTADASACNVTLPASCPVPAPTFADVTAIFAARCASCHAGDAGGPWPLDTYSDIVDWQGEIKRSLASCTMPPPDAVSPMTDAERATVLGWVTCGTPQ